MSEANQNVEPALELPRHKGLQFEEPLLFEASSAGSRGVDFPEIPNFKSRTGVAERAEIGLPEVGEPQVVRHFVRLSQQNFSIDSSFYPLGSCTMKHNPRLNEKVARHSGFSQLHPMARDKDAQGALELMYSLEQWLKELSGLDAVCLTPSAGAHGELAGMMVIRKAHEMRGRPRTTVLIPDSAHGTNPATAAACGYTTKTIPSKDGRIDLEAFKAALNDDVAALMLTNPNTCGLFETDAPVLAELLHKVGAYFYCDGANFNALVGRIRPSDFGVDVMHFNLHKTFSTPHGGGGPGCGPIAVSKELAPYLPVPRVEKAADGSFIRVDDAKDSVGRLRGFQGQFGMMVRALTYMMSHGGDGLRQVSEDAVLNANYILSQLKDDYHVPFAGTCMHECLLTDKIQQGQGITTLDIAKTLIEYGIHPMTIYFPLVVNGAMLIEPTETETKATLDEFIAVMKMIAREAREGKVEGFKQNPQSTPRKRLDEVQAARKPKLKY